MIMMKIVTTARMALLFFRMVWNGLKAMRGLDLRRRLSIRTKLPDLTRRGTMY
jgi:hypothetical protein